MENLFIEATRQANATLTGVWVGAAVTLIVSLLGNVLAPLVTEHFKRNAEYNRQERTERRSLAAEIRDTVVRASMVAPPRGERPSEEFLRLRQEYHRLVLGFRLGPKAKGDVSTMVLLVQFPKRAPEVSEQARWSAMAVLIGYLDNLVDDGADFVKVNAQMEHAFDLAVRARQRSAEPAAEADDTVVTDGP